MPPLPRAVSSWRTAGTQPGRFSRNVQGDLVHRHGRGPKGHSARGRGQVSYWLIQAPASGCRAPIALNGQVPKLLANCTGKRQCPSSTGRSWHEPPSHRLGRIARNRGARAGLPALPARCWLTGLASRWAASRTGDITDIAAPHRAESMRLAWADPARGEVDFARLPDMEAGEASVRNKNRARPGFELLRSRAERWSQRSWASRTIAV